jgi:anti-sigma factor RsiW
MQCEEFEDHLNAVLDRRGRVDSDLELKLHIETCPECRHVALSYDALFDGFKRIREPRIADDFGARVLGRVCQPRSQVRWHFAAMGALAASLLVSVTLLTTRTAPPVGDASGILADRHPAAVAAVHDALGTIETLPILQTLSALEVENEDVYGELAKETGSGLAAIVLYVPGIAGTRGIIDGDATPEEGDAPWAAQMSEGLKPVTDSVTETVNLLLKTLPIMDLASR